MLGRPVEGLAVRDAANTLRSETAEPKPPGWVGWGGAHKRHSECSVLWEAQSMTEAGAAKS